MNLIGSNEKRGTTVRWLIIVYSGKVTFSSIDHPLRTALS
jgi:hypothetical protein